jgi:hypothetical protein
MTHGEGELLQEKEVMPPLIKKEDDSPLGREVGKGKLTTCGEVGGEGESSLLGLTPSSTNPPSMKARASSSFGIFSHETPHKATRLLH